MEQFAAEKDRKGSVKSKTLDPVGKLLVKRSKMRILQQSPSGSMSPVTEDIPSPPSIDSGNAGILDCVELCRLLLEKVGADSSSVDSDELDRVLTTEYPPRVAELLVRITGTLDKDGIMDSLSDMTDSSDDEDSKIGDSAETTILESDTEGVDRNDRSTVRGGPAMFPGTDRVSSLPVASEPAQDSSNVVYKSETEIALSRIFNIGKTKAVQYPDIPSDAPYDGPSVITMTGFGELGRYGNQVLQYAFLKCYATMHDISEIQVPEWIGAPLFGLRDREVQRAFPAVVEFLGTKANSTFTDELIQHVMSASEKKVPELNSTCLAASFENMDGALKNIDIWGWFQWHTSVFRPFKSVIQRTFRPVPALDQHLGRIFNSEVRYKGGIKRTVIGIHLRYGDYQNIAASSFGYCAPTSWYIRWLEKIWPTLDNPILFVASDDLQAVLRDFWEYDPVTSDQIGMSMPESMRHIKAGFFPDWYGLTQCDVLGISNSTFSFTACMMNERPKAKFYRAHYSLEMVEVNPWDAHPIVHRDLNKGTVGNVMETLQLLYNTQGTKIVLRNMFYELPYYCLRGLIMKGVLWGQARN